MEDRPAGEGEREGETGELTQEREREKEEGSRRLVWAGGFFSASLSPQISLTLLN